MAYGGKYVMACECAKLYTVSQLERRRVCKKCGRDLPEAGLLLSIMKGGEVNGKHYSGFHAGL